MRIVELRVVSMVGIIREFIKKLYEVIGISNKEFMRVRESLMIDFIKGKI